MTEGAMDNTNEWITNNFEALVAKYGGKYIGVVNDKVVSSAAITSGDQSASIFRLTQIRGFSLFYGQKLVLFEICI